MKPRLLDLFSGAGGAAYGYHLAGFEHKDERAFADAMGCTWMTKFEARQAIPPAYTRFIGEQLMEHLTGRAAA